MTFKKSTCTNDIYISSQETIDNSEDDSRSDTGNDLETQVRSRTDHVSQRHVLNHGMQNNQRRSMQMLVLHERLHCLL